MRSRILAIVCMCLVYTTDAQQSLSFSACLDSVRSASPDARQYALAQAILDAQVKVNKLAYAPQLTLNGKATWQTDVTEFDIPIPGVEGPRPPQDQYAFTLDLEQTIYDGGYTKNQAAVLAHQASLSTLERLTQLQKTEALATDLFFSIALQQQLISTQNLLITQLDRVIRNLETHYTNGVVDKQAVLEARIRKKETEQRRSDAAKTLLVSKQSLAVLLDMDPDSFELEIPTAVAAPIVTTSFDKRADYRLLTEQASLYEASDLLNRSQYHPRLYAFGTVGYGNPGLNFLNTSFDTYALVGAALQVPLTQLYTGKASRESQISRIRQDETRLARESLQQQLVVQEMQYKSEIEKISDWLQDDAEIISMRAEIADVAEARHEAGVITTTDLLDHLTDLSLAHEQRSTHEIQLLHTQAKLLVLYGSNIQ